MIQSASIQARSMMPVATIGELSHSVSTRIASDVLRPPLKWAGGKRWQVPYLSALWAQHSQRRLVEPFCGGLSVSLGLMPERALINDINPHLVAFYRSLKSGLVVEDVGVDFRNAKATYLRNRTRFNELIANGPIDAFGVNFRLTSLLVRARPYVCRPTQGVLMFKRRIGLDPHRDGAMTGGAKGCPDVWELENGDFAVIGFHRTPELSAHLPATASCGPDEAIVVIPRSLLVNVKDYIPGE